MSTPVPFTKAQKAVTILVALGKPRASQLLKYFKNEEKRALVLAARALTTIEQPDLDNLVREFESDFARGAGLLDSSEAMDDILTEAFTPEEVEAFTNPPPAASAPAQKSVWEMLESAEPAKVAAFIQSENQQAGALVLSRLSGAVSASVIGSLERSTRSALLTLMMSMGPARPAAVQILEQRLRDVFAGGEKSGSNAGQTQVANILNQLDKAATEEALEDLTCLVEPERVRAVKSMLFRFEDIARLDAGARAAVFDQVPANLLTQALREAAPDVLESALSAIGQRTRRMIENDLKTPASSKPSETADARRQIVAAVLRLSADGRISLPAADLAA